MVNGYGSYHPPSYWEVVNAVQTFPSQEAFDVFRRRDVRTVVVQTDLLPGHAENEHAMPLSEYVAEVMSIIETQPDAREIQVERVKFLRYGEARGDYDQVVAALNVEDPHGK